MTTSKKIKSFVKEFVSVAKGDNVEAQAQKTYREADSELTAQIAVLKGKNVRLESAVENAQENLAKARVNSGTLIGGDGDIYISNLFEAKNDLTRAEENLSNNKKKIDFLSDQLESLNKDVDV